MLRLKMGLKVYAVGEFGSSLECVLVSVGKPCMKILWTEARTEEKVNNSFNGGKVCLL